MQFSKIIIAARADFISDVVRKAWSTAGVELLGPFSADQLNAPFPVDVAGALLDVAQDATDLFDLSERLVDQNLPFLFVVNGRDASSTLNPFVLDEDPGNRDAIFNALARAGHDGTLQ